MFATTTIPPEPTEAIPQPTPRKFEYPSVVTTPRRTENAVSQVTPRKVESPRAAVASPATHVVVPPPPPSPAVSQQTITAADISGLDSLVTEVSRMRDELISTQQKPATVSPRAAPAPAPAPVSVSGPTPIAEPPKRRNSKADLLAALDDLEMSAAVVKNAAKADEKAAKEKKEKEQRERKEAEEKAAKEKIAKFTWAR